jgi:carboxypeptidase Q
MCNFLALYVSFSLALGSSLFMPPKDQEIAKTLIQKGLKDSLGYDLIESLTTEVGPRMAGTPAEKRARDWAEKKFKSLGFKNVRVETFKMKTWERVQESARIVRPFPQNMRVTALGRSVSTPPQGVEGEVVRFATFQDLQKAPLKGFQGKVIFVDEPMTRTKDGRGYGKAVLKRYGTALEAGQRGAVAALIRSVGTDHHRFPHTGSMRYKEGIKKVPIGALSAPDADQLQRAMKRGPVSVSLNIQGRERDAVVSGNVIAEVPGETDDIVLIGAHLDSWDLGTGAVDDGAGVGIVMAAAYKILKTKKKPRRTIRVVLFGAEEMGLLGAKYYVEKYASEMQKHFLASESDFGAGQVWRLDTLLRKEHLSFQDQFLTILKPINIHKGNNEAQGGPDMIPFLEKGVPVFSLQQDGTDYFDVHHTEDDTFDKISKKSIQQNVAAWAAMTWMGANLKAQNLREKKL